MSERAELRTPAPELVGPRAPTDRPSPIRGVIDELRWSFAHPRPWLEGLAVNLVLSVLYLLWDPLTGGHRAAWVILVGSYFATFVLADVTSTNMLGHDRVRLRRSLANGVGIAELILRKNLVLLVVVGLPTLLATAVLTIREQDDSRLVYALAGVTFPIMVWLGVGNLVSVLMPVAWVPLRVRWRLRHRRLWTLRWACHLALPYALLYAVTPFADLPLDLLGHVRMIARHHGRTDVRGSLIALAGLVIWLGSVRLAAQVVQRRGLRIR